MRFDQNADWTFPVPIHYGPGRLAEAGALCVAAGMRNPMIVTDRGSRDLPFIAALAKALSAAGLSSAVYAEISPNPTEVEALAGAAAYQAGGHDGVVAIGGGSGMDGGKAISLLAGGAPDLWRFDYDAPSPAAAAGFPPLICIPTTAGTGAETESTAMVTDTAAGVKRCVWHPAQKPFAAILDPALTVDLPRNLTAWTGADALTHALEAYAVPALHPFCDGAALEGLRLINGALRQVVERPADMDARGRMLVGSCLAGVAFLKGLGLVHAISHMVGAVYDTQHGLTNAVLLPPVLRFNEGALGDKVGPIAAALDLGAADSSAITASAITACVEGVLDDIGIPKSLAAIGVPGDRSAEIAQKAMGDSAAGTNPRIADLAEVEAIFLEAVAGARA